MRTQLAQDLLRASMEEIIAYIEHEDDFRSKDLFFERDGEIVGLHEIGQGPDHEWCRMEAWANAYTLQFKFIASVARIFGPIEESAAELLESGWKRVQPPVNWGERQ